MVQQEGVEMALSFIGDNDKTMDDKKNRASYFKNIFHYSLMFIIILIGLELSLRTIYYQIYAPRSVATFAAYDKLLRIIKSLGKTQIINKQALCREDSNLGYGMIPGKHVIAIEWKLSFIKLVHRFTLAVGKDGYAITSDHPELYKNKPPIWIFGCSYTLGWPLDNKYSYPWLIQNKLTKYYIRNFGVNGYGNGHSLIQFKELLKTEKKPIIAIFSYNSFFKQRNVATSEIAEYKAQGVANPCYPRVGISDNGGLNIKLLPLKKLQNFDPDIFYMERITSKIFKEIKALCASHGIKPIIAVQYADDDDRVVMYCRSIGFEIADMRVDLNQNNLVYPFDPHPGPSVQKQYAQKLSNYLEPILK
jgi:hypothetical protein